MVGEIEIGKRRVGADRPCFIVAEAGVNHNGSLKLARRLIEVAAECGADAVKFQTFEAKRLVTSGVPKAAYQLRATDPTESQFDMLRRLELAPEAYRELMAYCFQKNILFMSTPFDEESADLLDSIGVNVFKIPSGEITNLPFLAHVARKGKPMIVSTGMASLEEVGWALSTIHEVGNKAVVLLHCVSDYPANPGDANLRAMDAMAATFGVPIGFSDHTMGIEVSLAAVALGACVIEKHFTLSRNLPGPDHRASLESEELGNLVRGIRIVEAALGHGRKESLPCEASTAAVVRKSIVAVCDIPAGTVLRGDLLTTKRPGTGLPPSMLAQLMGRVAVTDIPVNTILTLEMLR